MEHLSNGLVHLRRVGHRAVDYLRVEVNQLAPDSCLHAARGRLLQRADQRCQRFQHKADLAQAMAGQRTRAQLLVLHVPDDDVVEALENGGHCQLVDDADALLKVFRRWLLLFAT